MALFFMCRLLLHVVNTNISEVFILYFFGTVLCSASTRMLTDVFATKYFHLGELHINKCLIANKKYLTAVYNAILNKTDANGFAF